METILKTSIYLLLITGFTSCGSGQKDSDKPLAAKTEAEFQKDTTGCDCGDLVEQEENFMYKDGEKYSGICTIKHFDDKSNKEYRQYKKGLVDGTYYAWHENGKIKFKIDFVKGVIHGKFDEWNEKGKQITDISYDQGKLNGSSYVYNDDGIRYAIFLADSKLQKLNRTIYDSDFENSFKNYKMLFNNIGLRSTNPILAISTHFTKANNELLVIGDHIKSIDDINSFVEFVKQFEKSHKTKIVIDQYDNKTTTFDKSKDFSVWKAYSWQKNGWKKEIDDKI